MPAVLRKVFEMIPYIAQFESARQYVKGKMDFFTALYEFMDHEELEIRKIACRCLCDII